MTLDERNVDSSVTLWNEMWADTDLDRRNVAVSHVESAVFNGGVSFSVDMSNFGGGHNTICCHEKKHFRDPMVPLFRESSLNLSVRFSLSLCVRSVTSHILSIKLT